MMSMRHTARWISLGMLLAALLVGPGGRSDAAVTVYFDRASFEAASTSLSTIDFEGLAPVDDFSFHASPPGLTVDGVNFQSMTNNLFVIDPGYSFPVFVWDSGQYLMDNTFDNDPSARGLLATLPAGTTAVGTDLSSFGAGDISVTLSTGETFLVSSPGQPTYAFIGFTSTTPIDWLLFNKTTDDPTEPGDSVVLDNFSTGRAVAVIPEPATLASAMTALLLGAGYTRRRSKPRAA
jgi:hypothetical protein